MPLDPLSALSVAASVVQFVDFSTKIVSKGKKLYKSVDGALSENIELEAAAVRLQSLTVPIKSSLRSGSQGFLSETEQALEDICKGCVDVSDELVPLLKLLKLSEGDKHRKWKSCRQALKSMRSKEEIEEVASRLQRFRNELGTHVLIGLRVEVNSISIRQDEHFRALDRSTKEIVQSLLENCGTIDKTHKDTVEQFEAHSRSQREEHRKTRNAILGRDEQRCKRQVELSLLESLRFPTMTHRHEAIAEAHQRTFEWIFLDPDAEDQPWSSFVKWLEYGTGVYWINGKAGSGKSTLMRFIVDHLETRAHLDFWAQNGCLEASSFFFWNSGSLEQRSMAGLFRSLIYEGLRNHPYLISAVFTEDWRNGLELAKHDISVTFSDWSVSRLKRSFECLTSHASERLRFCFFIDGLDEYEGDYDQIAEYFSELSKSTFVKFCISSRPEPAFVEAFSGLPKLRLQDLTYNDIRDYTQDKLNAHKGMAFLAQADPEASTNLVLSVIERAQGVFLWVTLVVKSLLKGLNNKDGISHLVSRLEGLPTDLENLYGHMLASIEPIYQEFASKTFKLLHASDLSLRLRKLYYALAADMQRTLAAPIADLQAESAAKVRTFDIDSQAGNFEGVYDIQYLSEYMDTILQIRCGGLLEIQNYESESERGIREVEYIHRTARDYIESPIVWDSLPAHTADSTSNRFDPNMALMMSLILRLKSGHSWLRKDSVSTVEEEFVEASFFARKMDASNLDDQILLLNEFERVATELAQRKQLLPGQHWPNLDKPHIWKINFLSQATARGLHLYVKAKVSSDPSLIRCKSGIPLIGFTFLSTTLYRNLEVWRTLEVLLEHGADPNEIYEEHTLWQYWVHWVHTFCASPATKEEKSCIQRIFWLMIQRGVDLDVLCLNKSSVWNRIYGRRFHPGGRMRLKLTGHGDRNSIEEGEDSRVHTLGAATEIAMESKKTPFEEAHSLESVIKDCCASKMDPHGADELLELVAKLKAQKAAEQKTKDAASW